MANNCSYEMRVVGQKKSLKTFIDWLKNGYHYYDEEEKDYRLRPKKGEYTLDFQDGTKHLATNDEKHFWRVFEVDQDGFVKKDDNLYSVYLSGDCAWSVYSCMLEGEHTYSNFDETDPFYKLKKQHSTTLPRASKDLGVDIEVYSTELGMGFAEHYLIKNGEILVDEEWQYNEFYIADFDTKEEAEKEIGHTITNEEWEDRDYEPYIVRSDKEPVYPKWNI